MLAQQAAEKAIRDFPFDNYGMDDVDIAIREDPEAQEWIPALAIAVTRAVLLKINYGSPIRGPVAPADGR